MSAPFRITRPDTKLAAQNASEDLTAFLERLMKLIPVEVISLYLAGKGVLTSGQASDTPLSYWVSWTVFCLIAVLIVRLLGTADPKANTRKKQKPQIPAVLIACVSYGVWVYSMGDVFELLKWYEPKLGALMVLGWTFVAPYVYRGD